MAFSKTEFWEKLLIAAGMRKDYTGTPEEIVKRAKRINAHRSIPKIIDPTIKQEILEVDGFKVVWLRHKRKRSKAVLYIIGGGMVKAPRPSEIRKAVTIAKETNTDFFIPYYPLCTDYPISKTYEMIHATYKKILEKYKPGRVAVFGTSAGGNLALGLPAYINYYHLKVPMPALILAVSPATCVHSQLEWELMEVLDKKDIMVPAQFLSNSVEILKHGETNIPEFMFYLQNGDYTNCPKVYFMYGTEETLYACAPSFALAMKRYGVDYEMTVKEGMFHIYPLFPIMKEAREGWNEMLAILKGY